MARFRSLGIAGIIKKPVPLTMLYCWLRLGDKDELNAAISVQISSDFGLLDFLFGLKTWIGTSDNGVFQHIRPEVIGHFLDYNQIKLRLQKMLADQYPPMKERVSQVVGMIEDWDADDGTSVDL